MNQEPGIGDLLRRYVRTARLFDAESAIYSDKVPELLDVRLMAMSPQAFTLSRFERVAGIRARELALNLAIDSKLRGCDLVGLRVHDVEQGSRVAPRAIVMQTKTQRPVQFEIREQTRDAIAAWITDGHLKSEQFLFRSRVSQSPHLWTRQYSRIVGTRIASIGLNPAAYGTHSLRRTKATLIYGRTKNLRAVQLLLGHTKFESTVRYLGIEVDDALEIAEQTEV